MIPKVRPYRFDNHRVFCTWYGFWLITMRYDVECITFALWMKYRQKERLN
jgi:hypothetical protein